MRWAEAAREIATIRDPSQAPARRAFAAAALAAGEDPVRKQVAADPSIRMFGFDVRHDDAAPWDGRSMRSGTLTYVDDERVEQYVGQQKWIAYRRGELGNFRHELGDQVKITRRGEDVAIEAIGPNRLQDTNSAPVREVFSGMVVLRSIDFQTGEIDSLGQAVAERYSALARGDAGRVELEFRGGARLTVIEADAEPYAAFGESALITEPIAAALRLTVAVRSNKLDAALDAERALVLFAAMLASEGEAVAIDDAGAVFSADQLYVLGSRNEMRADAFAFAVAAAQRQWPVSQVWLSGREGVCDELTVFSTRPWRADFAATFLKRQLAGLGDAARYNDDPIVPVNREMFAGDKRGEPGSLERLAMLSYEKVDVEIAFIDVTCAGDDIREHLESRKDVEAVLGRPIASAVIVAFGNRDNDTESDLFGLEMRRAETLATVLAAAFAERGDCVAGDVAGALYAAHDLFELALRRCGKSTSWNARVASFASDSLDS
jgi:hypothetical protein